MAVATGLAQGGRGMRYEVDQRSGCIAVIDTTIPVPSPGLHSDDPHVVWFSHGYPEADPYPHWHIRGIDRLRAYRRAHELNQEVEG